MYYKFLLLSLALNLPSAILSSIPIWENLSKEEKFGKIFSILYHMVDVKCSENRIRDCQRTLTLHGISALLEKDDNTLDLLDPYQRLGQETIWKSLMEPKYKLPHIKTQVVIDNKPLSKTKIQEKTNFSHKL